MIYPKTRSSKVKRAVFPGLAKSISVSESAKIDESRRSRVAPQKPKQATGYEDAKVNIELILDDTTTQTEEYQRLETLQAISERPASQSPSLFPLLVRPRRHFAMGQQRFCSSHSSRRVENKKEQISVSLESLG